MRLDQMRKRAESHATHPDLLATDVLALIRRVLALEEALRDTLHLAEHQDALRAITENAAARHGDDAAKGRALAVIAKWARAALAEGEAR